MDVNSPQTYISIISSTLLIISEVLPYLPCSSNGIVHSITDNLKQNKTVQVHDEESKMESTTALHYENEDLNRLKQLEKDLYQVMKDLKANKTLEIDLNKKLNEIIHELKRINRS
jgi:hypothetical protein